MAYDSINKRLYVDEANGKGITLAEIALCLGGQRDLGMLCTSPEINRWSKNKPFVANADNDHIRGVQNAEDRYNAAYGFYWEEHIDDDNSPVARAALYAFERGVSNEDWNYNMPMAIFRLRDFDGYYHNAKKPYSCEVLSQELSSTKRFMMTTDMSDSDIEIRMSDMPPVGPHEDNPSDMEVVLLCRNTQSNDLSVVYTGEMVYNLDGAYGMVEASLKVKPTTADEPQFYEAVFAAWNGREIRDNPRWIYFPNTYAVTSMTGFYMIKYDWNEIAFAASNVNNYPLTSNTQAVRSISLWIDNLYNLDYVPEGMVIIKIWNKDAGFNSATEYEYPLHIDGMQELYGIPALDVTADKTMVAMDVYVRDSSIPIITSPDYASYHFNFLENKLKLGAASSADGVSVWDIKTYVDNNRP